ncbi:MAG: sugar phosphate isomerase/epimerase family protein [Opitutales bacterium]
MYLNFNAGVLKLGDVPFAQQCALAAANGFKGIDLPAIQGGSAADIKEAGRILADHGLVGGAFPLPHNIDADEVNFEEAVGYLEVFGPRLVEAGWARTYNWVLNGSNARTQDAQMVWMAERLQQLTAAAAKAGIDYGFEFIGPKTLQSKFTHPFIDDLAGAKKLIEAAGGGVGILLDSFHWYCSGGTLETLRHELEGIHITYVHVNDARADRTPQEQIDGERALPLETGVIDTPGMLKVLAEIGYEGPVTTEPFQPTANRLSALEPAAAFAEVGQVMRKLMDTAGL